MEIKLISSSNVGQGDPRCICPQIIYFNSENLLMIHPWIFCLIFSVIHTYSTWKYELDLWRNMALWNISETLNPLFL